MGFNITAYSDRARRTAHPPVKNRVGGLRGFWHSRARKTRSQPVGTHRERTATPAETVSGVHYYGYRFYSPQMGRWLSRDPVGEEAGMGLSVAVLNDPINRVDIYGLISFGGALDKLCRATGSWQEGDPTVSISNVDVTGITGPKLNPGGKIGIGVIGIDFDVTGNIKGTVVCTEYCRCKQRSWTINIDASVTAPVTVGVGISIKFLNWVWNWPKSAIAIKKAYQKYSGFKGALENRISTDAACTASSFLM